MDYPAEKSRGVNQVLDRFVNFSSGPDSTVNCVAPFKFLWLYENPLKVNIMGSSLLSLVTYFSFMAHPQLVLSTLKPPLSIA